MKQAIELAEIAKTNGDVPVGAIMVYNGEIIAKAYNNKEKKNNPTGHAEMNAIAFAAEKLGRWRLDGCTLYVTMEPCPMCAGAIMNARIGTVIFGAKDSVCGAYGSVIDICNYPVVHKPKVISGVCEKECADILQAFFRNRRAKNDK